MLRPGAASTSAAGTAAMNAIVLSMRAFRSAKLASSSVHLGTSWPASRATEPLAKSQAICTCRESGNMSGARRISRSTRGSILRRSADSAALSSMAASWVSARVYTGTVMAWTERLMVWTPGSGCGGAGERVFSIWASPADARRYSAASRAALRVALPGVVFFAVFFAAFFAAFFGFDFSASMVPRQLRAPQRHS